jgi:hypothetical protein
MADYINIETIKDLSSDELLTIQAKATAAMRVLSAEKAIELWGQVAGVAAAVTLEWVSRQ